MKDIEQHRISGTGSFVRPSAELKSSMDEISYSLEIANRLGVREFLGVINQEYFEGKGVIQGPTRYISSLLISKAIDDNRNDIELNNTEGGVYYDLNFGDDSENKIQICVNYYGIKNWIDLSQYATYNQHKKGEITVKSSVTRSFYINNDSRLKSTADSLFLAFIEELIEGGILK